MEGGTHSNKKLSIEKIPAINEMSCNKNGCNYLKVLSLKGEIYVPSPESWLNYDGFD